MKYIVYDREDNMIAEGDDRNTVITSARDRHNGMLIGEETKPDGRKAAFIVRGDSLTNNAMWG